VAKVALALWGAHILVVKRAVLHQYRHLLVPVVPAALVMFTLVMFQPDLGGTVTLGVVLIALLWFAGAPMRMFGGLALGAVAGVVVLAIGTDYRLSRVLSFLRPEDDPGGAAYQATQAVYALADGGLFGKGLGQGPSKWQYLPNVDNDFIFALIGEELGFLARWCSACSPCSRSPGCASPPATSTRGSGWWRPPSRSGWWPRRRSTSVTWSGCCRSPASPCR
jgi:cell division protein FtsW